MGCRSLSRLRLHGVLRVQLAAACLFTVSLLTARAPAEDNLLKQLFDKQAAAAMEAAKSPPKATEEPDEPPRLLVLTDDHVVTGTIRSDPRGYRVATPDGNLFFTNEAVKFTALDLEDAYRKLRASVAGPRAQRDLRLGRWCYDNKLPREAAIHLRSVLKLEPTNQVAKDLLGLLEMARRKDGSFDATVSPRAGTPQAAIAESLSRMPPAVVEDFVLRVQPILMNRCGNARCHGEGGESSFRLERVRMAVGGNRAATGRNLESVLSRVDPQFSRQSPLLQKSLSPHGGLVRPPLSGPNARQQEARLAAWLQSAAPSVSRLNRHDASQRSIESMASQAGKQSTRRDPLVMPASATDVGTFVPVPPPSPLRAKIAARKSARDDASAADAVGKSEATRRPDAKDDLGPLTDPFDPTQFNREIASNCETADRPCQQHQRSMQRP